MFKFLKEKIKKAVSAFSEKVEEEAEDVEVEVKVEKPKKVKKEVKKKEVKEKPKKVEKKEEKKPKKKEAKKPAKKKEKLEQQSEQSSDVHMNSKGVNVEPVQKEEPAEEKIEVPEDKKESVVEVLEEVDKELGEKPADEPPTEKEMAVEDTEQHKEEKVVEKKGFFKRWFGKKEEEKETEEVVEEKEAEAKEVAEEKVEEVESKLEEPAQREGKKVKEKVEKEPEEEPELEEKELEEPPEKEKGFFAKITQKIIAKEISQEQFEDLFWELEVALLENNVAVEVIEKIKEDLSKNLVGKPIKRTAIMETILNTLKDSVEDLFVKAEFDFMKAVKSKKPYILCFVGINGSGKTTTIAKVTKLLQDEGLSVVLAAADTFRAAAIDQLQTHADRLGVKLIKHEYGSDPAAVAFDAVKHAEAKKLDVVIIDTAGRMHSNVNLLDEMKKIVRVAKPDMNIFVGESITGNDCVEQAKKFNEVVELDGIILSKADIDEKGGAALSVSYVTGKPILFLGTGQGYKDLSVFEKDLMLGNLGL